MARRKGTYNRPNPSRILSAVDTELIKDKVEELSKESDIDILDRLKKKSEILTTMTRAVKNGHINAMIVSGPPGIGKSYGVESVLEQDNILDVIADRVPTFEVIRGAVSSIGLYAKLFQYRAPGNILVFDDSDSIFFDSDSLNILKSALNTSDHRFINWNKESRTLREEDVPNRFEFRAGVIFITNIKFANIRSKNLRDHLDALESRCHYIDLEMDTDREKMIWINHLVEQQGMLDKYKFTADIKQQIMKYISDNTINLRELSLRTVIKCSDLYKMFPNTWREIADVTLMRKAFP
jgi:hypothetical protein